MNDRWGRMIGRWIRWRRTHGESGAQHASGQVVVSRRLDRYSSQVDGGGDADAAGTASQSSGWRLWARNSVMMADLSKPGKDGRVRLRGPQSLDICVSRPLVEEAIAAFEGWMEALATENIALNILHIDGWRVCAVVDSLPLAIRVRERMQRAYTMGGLNRFLERVLGGQAPEYLEPSGELELQVMRHGVCAASVPFQPQRAPECYQAALQILADLGQRERRYQQRLRSRAKARRTSEAGPEVPSWGNPQSQRFSATASRDMVAAEEITAANALAACGNTREQDRAALLLLLTELETLLQRINPAAGETVSMGVSLGNLAIVCGQSQDQRRPELATIRMESAPSVARKTSGRGAASGRKRVVA